MEAKVVEIAGFRAALSALKLPYGKECKTNLEDYMIGIRPEKNLIFYQNKAYIDEGDLALMNRLMKTGDEHAKILRGIVVYMDITAPMYWWNEAVTYKVGAECLSSTSTMHIECRRLQGEELQKAKSEITMGHEYRRIVMFSYQTLRRIYYQRRHHRLPEWKMFCEFIETMPYAKDLILGEKENEVIEDRD